MTRGIVTTALLLLACWPAWEASGWLAAWLGLAVLDLPIRAGGVLLLLAAAEACGA